MKLAEMKLTPHDFKLRDKLKGSKQKGTFTKISDVNTEKVKDLLDKSITHFLKNKKDISGLIDHINKSWWAKQYNKKYSMVDINDNTKGKNVAQVGKFKILEI